MEPCRVMGGSYVEPCVLFPTYASDCLRAASESTLGAKKYNGRATTCHKMTEKDSLETKMGPIDTTKYQSHGAPNNIISAMLWVSLLGKINK